MYDVMFYEVFEEEEAAIKACLPPDVHAGFSPKTIQDEKDPALPSTLISIRTQSRIPSDWVPNIKGVLTRSQGYDHLVAFRRQSGVDVPCGYLGSYCDRAVAEHAILLMLALMRRLTKQLSAFATFTRDGLTGRTCTGKNALVVGVGRIGGHIVDMAKGLRMSVKGVDIVRRVAGLEYVPLEAGVRWAQVIFCACPLTDQTRGMLNYDVLKQASPGLVLINIARGEITPAKDLERLLSEGVLSGLGRDVYDEESTLADYLRNRLGAVPPGVQSTLSVHGYDKVIYTPHNAFNTEEALKEKARLSALSVVSFLEGGAFPLPVP